MKKTLLIAATVLLAAMNANAQRGYDDTKHEWAISYGMMSNSQWIDLFAEVAIMENGTTFSNEDFVGAYSIEYLHRFSNWLSAGCGFTFGQSRMDFTSQADVAREGVMTNRYYSLMPTVKFDWLRTGHFGMYSKLAVGYTFRTIGIDYDDASREDVTDKTSHLNWQISPLGVEAGGTKLRGFIEAGIGEQGAAILGIRYKF